MKNPRLALALLAVAVVGYFATRFIVRNPPAELTELAAEQGSRPLREPLRPIRGGTRMVVFALDGVGHSVLEEALLGGRMKHTASLTGRPLGGDLYEHAYAAPNVLSILPSTTMAAWSSLYTGAPPAQTGIPGNEWFERERATYMAPAPLSVDGHEHTLEMLNDGLVGNAIQVPTLFERLDLRAHVSMAPVYRGADVFTLPDASLLADAFGQMAKGIAGETTVKEEAYSEIDLEAAEQVVEAFDRFGFPDLQVVYFPAVDLYTHVAEDPLAAQRRYVETHIDSAVGLVLGAYERAGLLDSLYVLFVADHGHTPVTGTDRHALSSAGPDEPTAVLQQLGFRLPPDDITPQPESTYQAAVAYQGAMAYIYLADRSTCSILLRPCDWSRPPRMEQDVMPVVRALYAASAEGERVPELTATLDLVLAREPRPTGTPAAPFQVFDGQQLVPIAEYLRRNPRPDLLDFERRMNDLAAGPMGHRAGDVLVLARSGMHRPIHERFYFSNEYRSWHGSPHAQDSTIPLLLARRGAAGPQLRTQLHDAVGPTPTQLDVTRLIIALLKGE